MNSDSASDKLTSSRSSVLDISLKANSQMYFSLNIVDDKLVIGYGAEPEEAARFFFENLVKPICDKYIAERRGPQEGT